MIKIVVGYSDEIQIPDNITLEALDAIEMAPLERELVVARLEFLARELSPNRRRTYYGYNRRARKMNEED